MRKRWEFNPLPYAFAWFVLGLVGFVVVGALTNPCDPTHQCGMNSNHMSAWSILALCLWVGPFVVAGVCAGIVFGAVALWAARPRRVVEPVREDLRAARK